MKNRLVVCLLIVLLTSCKVQEYDFAYKGIDCILNKKYGNNLLIEECYYVESNVLSIDSHLVYKFHFLNQNNQTENRYFLYMVNGAHDDFYEAQKYYEIAVTSDYYIKLNVEKLNEYLKEKELDV